MTLNLEQPDALAEGLDIVHDASHHMPIVHAMANGFGSGGVNASLVFKRWGA